MARKILPPHHHHDENLNRLLEHIPDCAELEIVANVFKEVSDSSRIRIFWLLSMTAFSPAIICYTTPLFLYPVPNLARSSTRLASSGTA